MDKLFLTILNMSLTGAFVIAAICLARLPLKKAPKLLSYCLWAVAGFRLVFPFSIESALSLLPFHAQTIPSDIAMQAVPKIDSGMPYVNDALSGVLPASTPYASVNPLQIWIAVGAFIWIAGVTLLSLYGVISFFVLKHKMKAAIPVEKNIYEAETVKSPFVLGVLKPKIYLPVGLSTQERSYTLLHEQTHIKRHDPMIKFAAYFILCLHWFNPLAWAAFLLMGVDMEMSCDERVLKEVGGDMKKEYSLSLLSLATQRRFVGSSPLAFGEGGVKERIKHVLHFKTPSRAIVMSAVVLVAVLSTGFALNKTVDKHLSMQGINLSDLQTDEIIRHIAKVTHANEEGTVVPPDHFELHVSGDFDWTQAGGTVSMLVSKSNTGGEPYYACQLRIFADERNYWVTKPQRQAAPAQQYPLKQYLDALKYLPQEHIRSLVRDHPDEYIIVFRGNGMINDGQPCVFYNKGGLTGSDNGWVVRFDILPMYAQEDGGGYHGLGSDAIHVFYGDGSIQTVEQTYRLENAGENAHAFKMTSVMLSSDGTAMLFTPPISSYLLPPCVYALEKDELVIYARISTSELEEAYGVKSGDAIAVFTVAEDGALVFTSATVPLYADEGARYALPGAMQHVNE